MYVYTTIYSEKVLVLTPTISECKHQKVPESH